MRISPLMINLIRIIHISIDTIKTIRLSNINSESEFKSEFLRRVDTVSNAFGKVANKPIMCDVSDIYIYFRTCKCYM